MLICPHLVDTYSHLLSRQHVQGHPLAALLGVALQYSMQQQCHHAQPQQLVARQDTIQLHAVQRPFMAANGIARLSSPGPWPAASAAA